MTIPDHKVFYTGIGPGARVFEVTTYGFEALKKSLEELPEKVRTNCIEQALRAGGKEIVREAKNNIRSKSGALASSITIRKDKKNPFTAMQIGAFGKTLWYKGQMVVPFYAHMIEWGTKGHFIPKPGPKESKSPLLIPGSGHPIWSVEVSGIQGQRPFTKAVENTRTDFLSKFSIYIDKFILKHFKDKAPRIR